MGCSCSGARVGPATNSSLQRELRVHENRPNEETMMHNHLQSADPVARSLNHLCKEGENEKELVQIFDTDCDTNTFQITTQDLIVTDTTIGVGTFPSFYNIKKRPKIFEYQFYEPIGKGSRSDVFRVENTDTGEEFAGKVYEKAYLFRACIGDPQPPITQFLNEVQIMNSMNHPNILRLVDLLDDEITNTYIMILPYARGGSLSNSCWKATPLPEFELKFIFSQVAAGLAHMHSLNIIHRDIKPENILRLDDNLAVISDFSASLSMEDDPGRLLEDSEGTPAFYSPEECSGEPYSGKKGDVWSLGMTMYVMAMGKLPYLKDDDVFLVAQFYKIACSIMNDEIEYPSTLSSELVSLFRHMLDKNPDTRYTMEQVLSHPWMCTN